MSLLQFQNALARLYTDAGLRHRFVEDAEATGRELGLSEEETRQLAVLAADQVEFFARALVSKRGRVVSKLLPRTARALGDRFERLFARYASEPMPGGHREDACGFAGWLFNRRELSPDWVADLARLEAGWLKMWRPGFGLLLLGFRYHADLVARAVAKGESPAPARGPMLGIWVRLPGLEARFLALRLPGAP